MHCVQEEHGHHELHLARHAGPGCCVCQRLMSRVLIARAKDAGIVILNEIGLDPGIDHLTAMSTIDSVREQGGQVR